MIIILCYFIIAQIPLNFKKNYEKIQPKLIINFNLCKKVFLKPKIIKFIYIKTQL